MKTNAPTLRRRLRHLALACVTALTLSPQAHARTIAWGTDVGSVLLDSSSAPLDASFVFELGTFGSFVPTAANVSSWLTNWKVFDRATSPTGWNPGAGWVASSATMESDQTTSRADLPQVTFSVGEQAYILGYDSLSLGSPGTEFALVTDDSSDGNAADNWLMPLSDTHSPDFLDWRINAASTVIFGGLNNLEGAGSYTVDPGAFTLQTHTNAAAVPEPSSALLIASLGLLTRLRRRRE